MSDPDPAAAAVVDDYDHISHALGHPVPAKLVRTDDGRTVTCRLAFKDPDPKVAVLLNIISSEEAAAIIEAGAPIVPRAYTRLIWLRFFSGTQAASQSRGWTRDN